MYLMNHDRLAAQRRKRAADELPTPSTPQQGKRKAVDRSGSKSGSSIERQAMLQGTS